MTDPISDLLTRIRNAQIAGHEALSVPHSKLKEGILKVLREEGFIASYKVGAGEGDKKSIQVHLRYTPKKEPVITGIVRESSPGRRIYIGYEDLRPVKSTLGISILSTPRGILTDRQAREEKVGGELLCRVW